MHSPVVTPDCKKPYFSSFFTTKPFCRTPDAPGRGGSFLFNMPKFDVVCNILPFQVMYCMRGAKGPRDKREKEKTECPLFTNALKSPLEAPRAVLRACLVSFPTYPLQKRVHVPESLLWRFCSSSSFSFLLLMPFPTVKTCRISPLNAVFPPRFFRAR